MQYPEPDDGAWPARVLRNRRMNQVPETENPATPLRFMHQRPTAGSTDDQVNLAHGFDDFCRALPAARKNPAISSLDLGHLS